MEELKIRYSDNLTLSEVLSVISNKTVIDNITKPIEIFGNDLKAYSYTYNLSDDITVSIYKEGSGLTVFVGKVW